MKGSKGPGLGLVRVTTFLNSMQYKVATGAVKEPRRWTSPNPFYQIGPL